ncbi:MAG: exodeoxyribonuclease V subunit gamma [Planctomycetes bacterium]|nr:exodeoxyribonuclease V subunit gamma [Planctomycetota bacterium]
MVRRLYRGDFQPTLEDALVAELRAAKADDPLARVDVVVPSNLLKLHLRRLLAERLGAHVDVRFMTLNDLAARVTERPLFDSGLRRLPSAAADLVAAELAHAVPPASAFATVARLPRFAGVLAATLRDLRDAAFSADDLDSARIPDLPQDERAKIADVAALLRAYEQRLDRERAVDDAALLRLASEQAAASPAFCASTRWFIFGFYDFTAMQRALVDAIVARSAAIVFVPAYESAAGSFAKPALRAFEALGFAPVPVKRMPPASALELVRERSFVADASTPAVVDDSVRLVSAASAAHEAREVVRIVRDVAQRGLPLHRIAVLARDADDVARVDAALRSALEHSDLAPTQWPPVHVHGGRAAQERRAIRAALLALDVVASGLERRTLFEWLHFAGGANDVRAWEDVARLSGVVGGSGDEEWRLRLSHARLRVTRQIEAAAAKPEDDEAEDRGRLERRRDAIAALDPFVDGLAQRLRALEAAPTFSAKVDAFRDLLACGGMHAADLDRVVDTLAPLRELDEFSIVATPAAFALATRTQLEGATDQDGAFERGLFLGTVAAARGLSFDVVILCGLAQGRFPRRGTQDPILLDDERRALSRSRVDAGRIGLPLANRTLAEDRMLFRMVLGAARTQLVATWARFDTDKNRESLPSTFVLALAEALAGKAVDLATLDALPQTTRVSGSPTRFDREPIDLREFDRAAVAAAVTANDSGRALFLRELHAPLALAWRGELERWRTPAFTTFDGVFDAPTIGLVPPPVTSASALETYAVCPFRYFARHTLGLDEPEEPEERLTIEARDRGTLVHAILRETVEQLMAAREWPPSVVERPVLRAVLGRVAKKRFDTFEIAHATGLRLVWDVERSRWLDAIETFLASGVADSGTGLPALLEAAFGLDSNVPRLRLDVAGRVLEIEGQIDRVDVDTSSNTAAVFDYKTGRAGKPWIHVDGGRRLQLPLYAKAVEHVLRPGVRVTRAAYLHCRPGSEPEALGVSPVWSGPDEPELQRVLALIVTAIERGVFFANAGAGDPVCGTCDVRLVCGLGAGLEERFERKRGDPVAQVYFDLDAQQQDSEEDA